MKKFNFFAKVKIHRCTKNSNSVEKNYFVAISFYIVIYLQNVGHS